MPSIRILFYCLLLLIISACGGTPDTPYLWTWISGADFANQSANYGSIGVPLATNVPGAREQAVTWRGNDNFLWMFGGYGLDSAAATGKLNDLWKFDGSNWTWVKGDKIVGQWGVYGTLGSPDPSNKPGGRSNAMSWRDSSGNFWLFGGAGYDISGNNGRLNCLWEFNGTNWAWMSGASTFNQFGNYGTLKIASATNVPGAREGAVTWIDSSDNLWLFGGYGYDKNGTLGYLNDLWKYDPGTKQWTWISGSDTVSQIATYGSQGVPNALNVPGARQGAVAWVDGYGNLWLFGGVGYNDTVATGNLNDLWKFDGTSWTWIGGSKLFDQSGTYGTQKVASSSNIPGGRQYAAAQKEQNGTVWLFGGYNGSGYFNDLWRFDGSNWTWISGSNTVGGGGTYGTKGTPDTANTPGARQGSVTWLKNNLEIWIFGGSDTTSTNLYNDLWRFVP